MNPTQQRKAMQALTLLEIAQDLLDEVGIHPDLLRELAAAIEDIEAAQGP